MYTPRNEKLKKKKIQSLTLRIVHWSVKAYQNQQSGGEKGRKGQGKAKQKADRCIGLSMRPQRYNFRMKGKGQTVV